MLSPLWLCSLKTEDTYCAVKIFLIKEMDILVTLRQLYLT